MAAEEHQPPRMRHRRRRGRRETCDASRLVAVAAAIVIAAVRDSATARAMRQRSNNGRRSRRFRLSRSSRRSRAPRSSTSFCPAPFKPGTRRRSYARVSGYLKNWYFDYGAHVKKGDLLAEIDAPDLDAQLAASQAKLNSARATVKVREAEKEFAETTYRALARFPKGGRFRARAAKQASRLQQRRAALTPPTAEVAADQGDVDRLQALADFKRITAPFDGVVTARETDIGALINAGSGTGGGNGPELFRVADIHEMRVYVQVPQQLTAGIQPGLTADLNLPQHPDKTFKATVATTSNAINENARTLLVELHADNPDGQLQPGAYAQVDFRAAEQPACRPAADQRVDFPRERVGSRDHRPGQQNRDEADHARAQSRHRGRSAQGADTDRSRGEQSAGFAFSRRRGSHRRSTIQQRRQRRAVRQTGKRRPSGSAGIEALANKTLAIETLADTTSRYGAKFLGRYPDVPRHRPGSAAALCGRSAR